jgi:nucleotide-binding universal stress UspA family protein
MYRSIITPLDGSVFSEHALPLALSIARRTGAGVRLAHVHTPAMALTYPAEYAAFDATLDIQMRESERAYLDGLAQRLAASWDVPITVALLDGLPVAGVLHDDARAAGSDLVVMTTHGRTGLSRFWMGSVADALARQATIPTLLVRPREDALDLIHEQDIKHILIPLDGSRFAEQVLERTIPLGVAMQAEYTLLHAIDPLVADHTGPPYTVGLDEALYEQIQTGAQNHLDRVAERLRAQSLRVSTRLVAGQPANAILTYAREHGVDLIAMATHGRGGISRMVLGSVADKVVRGACAPVLLQRLLDATPALA